MKKYFGLLPAAGLATRMRPFRYPKELLPIHYETIKDVNYLKPKLLIEHALEALACAFVNQLYIVVPAWKPEIMRYLEDGRDLGHSISYLYNSNALGLADALLSGFPWLQTCNTCFAMPDTLFSPVTAFQDVIKEFEISNADLVLGVFPTSEAQFFGTVEFDETGRVINIEEKPSIPKVNNAWGIAVWNPEFWTYFKQQSKFLEVGGSVTEIFDKAAKNGLNVRCVYFKDGWYRDIGRINAVSFNEI